MCRRGPGDGAGPSGGITNTLLTPTSLMLNIPSARLMANRPEWAWSARAVRRRSRSGGTPDGSIGSGSKSAFPIRS